MKISICIFFILSLNLAIGQSETSVQIDSELTKCLEQETNYTTSGMTNCIIEATKKLDKRLNDSYQSLLKILTVEQKKMLVESQKSWIVYRDKEIEFSNQLYYDMEGTMWIPINAETKMNLTKQRILEIENYIENKKVGN